MDGFDDFDDFRMHPCITFSSRALDVELFIRSFVVSFVRSFGNDTIIASVAFVSIIIYVYCMVVMTCMRRIRVGERGRMRRFGKSEGRRKGAVAKDASGWNVFAGVRRGGGNLALGDLFFGYAGNGTAV